MEHCEFAQMVSEFIDEELSNEDAKLVKDHIISCSICTQALQSYLSSRNEIRSYKFIVSEGVQVGVLQKILGCPKTSLWRKRIAIPVPVAMTFALVMIVLVLLRVHDFKKPMESQELAEMPLARSPLNKDTLAGVDLARFDHGERAVIYKEQRIPQANER
jgi:hypothetical protein